MHITHIYRLGFMALILALCVACAATTSQPTPITSSPSAVSNNATTQPPVAHTTTSAQTVETAEPAAPNVSATAAAARSGPAMLPPLRTQWMSDVSPDSVLPEYPRPQMVRQDWYNLNGLWQFGKGEAGQLPPYGQQLAEEILVPFPIESALSGLMRTGQDMWYRRTFTVPDAWSGQHVLLHFGAVDWQATVYVNGHEVGSHTGGYDSFSFDITQQLHSGENELIVGVHDPTELEEPVLGKQRLIPREIWYTSASGIWQTVWLEPVAAASIARLDMIPEVEGQVLKLTVQGTGTIDETVEVVASADGVEVGRASGPVGSEVHIPVPQPRLWSPDDPFLYDLEVSLKRDDELVDRVTSYFGMRSVGLVQVGDYLRPVLNGEFVFQMGLLDQGYWPDGIYTAPTDEALRYDIEQAKALGYNLLRKHMKVEPQRWYYWADKLGVLVWQDMPALPEFKSDISTAARKQFELELKELVDEHRSSPAIIMWVPFNEGWGQYDQARIADVIKGWDPSRLVDNMSGVNCCGAVDGGNGDVLDWHVYVGPDSGSPSDTRAAVLGEYGGLGLKVVEHEWNPVASFNYEMQSDADQLTNRYLELLQQVRSLMFDRGLSAAVYTQLTDVEIEVNGIMTYDRAMVKLDASKLTTAHKELIESSKSIE